MTAIIGVASNTAQVPWIGTMRARFGYAFNRLLLATGGGIEAAVTESLSTRVHGNLPRAGLNYRLLVAW